MAVVSVTLFNLRGYLIDDTTASAVPPPKTEPKTGAREKMRLGVSEKIVAFFLSTPTPLLYFIEVRSRENVYFSGGKGRGVVLEEDTH